jgi:hypothetical protein
MSRTSQSDWNQNASFHCAYGCSDQAQYVHRDGTELQAERRSRGLRVDAATESRVILCLEGALKVGEGERLLQQFDLQHPRTDWGTCVPPSA